MRGTMRLARELVTFPTVVLVSLGGVRTASAQAWAPPAGAGAVTLAVQTIDNTGHRLSDGSMLRGYDSRSATLQLDVDYAVTDRFSISVTLPYVFAKYTGPEPSFSALPVDECHCWNRGFQDFGLTARYSLARGALAVTPSVSLGMPSHDYAYFGEAVLGRNLTEWRLAIDAGRRLDAISPRLSMAARYAYTVSERVLDIKNDRSNTTVEGAFQFTRRLSSRAVVSWQRTHGGLRYGSPEPADLVWPGEFDTTEKLQQYDRLVRDNNWRVGAGLAYSLPRVDLFGSALRYMGGTDTHAGYALTLGISVPFELPYR